MIEKHRAQLRALDDEATELVAELFKIDDNALLIPTLEQQGVVQADVVMALLRAPPSRGVIASAALGQLVRLIRQPCERPWPRPLPKMRRIADPDEWWVCQFKGSSHAAGEGWLTLPCAGEFGSWSDRMRKKTKRARIKIGMTVREMIGLGVTRETIEKVRRERLVRFSSKPRRVK